MNKWRLKWTDMILILLCVGVIVLAAILMGPQLAHINFDPEGPDNLFMGTPWI